MSHIRITLPSVMSRYLLIIAAMISVPPVLPFAENATPIPPPQKDAPSTHAMKGWSLISEPFTKCWKIGVANVSTPTANIVFRQNFSPKIFNARRSRLKLIIRYVYCTGKPVAQYTTEAMPGTAPEGKLFGNKNTVHPMAYIIIPNAINR